MDCRTHRRKPHREGCVRKRGATVTTDEIRALLDAKGNTAHCPAHDDRSKSLSIREGRDGRSTILHCFAGCPTTAITAALGLSMRDLFSGPPPSPEHLAVIRAERERKEAERQCLAAERREALDRLDRIQLTVNALGAKLARTPDNDKLAAAFHKECMALHEAEQGIRP